MSQLKYVALVCVLMLMGPSAWAIKDPETGVVFPDSVSCGGCCAAAMTKW